MADLKPVLSNKKMVKAYGSYQIWPTERILCAHHTHIK